MHDERPHRVQAVVSYERSWAKRFSEQNCKSLPAVAASLERLRPISALGRPPGPPSTAALRAKAATRA